MAESLTIDVRARVMGYEQSIKNMKKALENVDPGSAYGKSLSKAIDAIEKKIE